MSNRIGITCVVLAIVSSACADVPPTMNHQGVVRVNGQPFNGIGHFKFAILNANGVNVWTNDNSNLVFNDVPESFEDVVVADGVYSVILGGAGPGYTMTPIAPTVFNEPDRRLRIWFDDGVNGQQQLTPDHTLTSSPYSQQSAFEPPIGSIIAWHKDLPGVPGLPEGWIECTNPTGTATINVTGSPLNGQPIPQLNDNPPSYLGGGRFLRGGIASGTLQGATVILNMQEVDALRSDTALEGGEYEFDPVIVNTNASKVHLDAGPSTTHPAQFVSVRPVNMSVVWIMRVK